MKAISTPDSERILCRFYRARCGTRAAGNFVEIFFSCSAVLSQRAYDLGTIFREAVPRYRMEIKIEFAGDQIGYTTRWTEKH